MELPVDIARATVDNLNFIRDSWLKSYRDSAWVAGIPSAVFYPFHGIKVDMLLNESDVRIAHYRKDPNQVYGWIAARVYDTELIVHYIYVKSTFRKFGIGRDLLSSVCEGYLDKKITATHRTWSNVWLDSKLKIEYNPYLIDSIVGGANERD